MAQPIKCRSCGKPFNPSFTQCPFCKTSVQATAPKTKLDYAGLAAQAVGHFPMLKLSIHPAAIGAMDTFIFETWGNASHPEPDWQPTHGQRLAIADFGALFGEVVRQQFGGFWEEDPAHVDDVLFSSIALRQMVRVFPMRFVLEQLRHGREPGVLGQYDEIVKQLAPPPNRAEADGWLEQFAFFRQVGRLELALPFLERALRLRPSPELAQQIRTLQRELAAERQHG